MKKATLALFLMMVGTTAFAQSKFNIKGTIIEKGTNEAIPSASVRILSLPDSSMVTGASTSPNGTFNIQSVKKGKYALKVTFIGYQDHTISLDLTNQKDKTVDVGYLTLIENSKLLKETVVSANVAQVQASGDSLVYNASAYRVPEGSALEDLVKKLPGAEIDDDGNITINGKTVKKILVDGKEFFLNDKNIALKNLPTNIIDRIKTYDRKSDLARVTGIDDGEEETVLDLAIKKGMNQGWFGTLDGAVGTKHRYSERINVNRFMDDVQLSLIANSNNTGERGFGGGGGRGWGWGNNGLRSSKEVGFNFATAKTKLETGGNVRFRYDGSDNLSKSSTREFYTEKGTFSNNRNQSYSSNWRANADFRFEWKPDTMTNIIFRPSANIGRNRGITRNISAAFNGSPYERTDEHPLNWAMGNEFDPDTLFNIITNTNLNDSRSYSANKGVNGELQVNRRLSDNGRNITFRATGGLSTSESKSLSAANISYRSRGNQTINNRYNTTPGKNANYSLQLTYSEPIADKTYLQLSYRFNYRYSKNDRQANVFTSNLTLYNAIKEAMDLNRFDLAGAYDRILSLGAEYQPNLTAYEDSLANRLSQFSEYKNYDHTIGLSLRKVTDFYNLSVGVEALPQHSVLDYKYMGKEYPEVTRSVFNFTPTMDFRYNFNKTTQFRLNYRGRTSQPSMTNLLDITDDSNPMNISKGNPGLKPSFSSNVNMNFNTYNTEIQQGIFAWGGINFTRNNISNETEYDATTGVRTTTPKNINGNWNGNIGFGYNRGLGASKAFTVNTFTNFGYNHQVSYYFVSDSATLASLGMIKGDLNKWRDDMESTISATNRIGVGERLSFGYRKDWFEASVNGNVNYVHSRNNIMTRNNLDTWNFSYGAELNFIFMNGLSIHTDISENSRRGYTESSMNTNELIWNAMISKSFLKGKALTISAQWNDILANRSNISRNIQSLSSSDTEYNAIYSYGMLHVIYKLNIFGGKNANGTANARTEQRWGGFPGGGPGGRPGGRR